MQVNLSLPTARDPLEEKNLTLLVIDRLVNSPDHPLLVGIQGQGGFQVIIVDRLGVRVAINLNWYLLQPALLGSLIKGPGTQLGPLFGVGLLNGLADDALQILQ